MNLYLIYTPEGEMLLSRLIPYLASAGIEVWSEERLHHEGDFTTSPLALLARCDAALFLATPASLNAVAAYQQVMTAYRLRKPLVVLTLQHLRLPTGLDTLPQVTFFSPTTLDPEFVSLMLVRKFQAQWAQRHTSPPPEKTYPPASRQILWTAFAAWVAIMLLLACLAVWVMSLNMPT